MSDEKPLHVRVAEALGCKPESAFGGRVWKCQCGGGVHGRHGEEPRATHEVARYDTSWESTGPLLERLRIDLRWGGSNLMWWAGAENSLLTASSPVPLEAVCHLVLALHAAGKMPRSPASVAG